MKLKAFFSNLKTLCISLSLFLPFAPSFSLSILLSGAGEYAYSPAPDNRLHFYQGIWPSPGKCPGYHIKSSDSET